MISIVVPVYNAGEYIEECIGSVLGQSYTDWQLIIVNDGSTDDSPLRIKPYLGDPRIKYIEKENSGVTATRWVGVEQAEGETITFLDADDVLLAGALEKIHSHLCATGADIVTFDMVSFSDLAQIAGKYPDGNIHIHTDKMVIADRVLSGKMMSCVCGGAYHTATLRRHKNEFCNGLRIAEDTCFNLLLTLAEQPKVAKIDTKIYGYRVNQQSATRAVSRRRFDAVASAISFLCRFEVENPEYGHRLRQGLAFRKLLLWSTFMFHPQASYYRDTSLRREMRRCYPLAFSRLYPYLKVYLAAELYFGSKSSQWLIRLRKRND